MSHFSVQLVSKDLLAAILAISATALLFSASAHAIVTSDSAGSHVVSPGQSPFGFGSIDGVCRIEIYTGIDYTPFGSGTLLFTSNENEFGLWVLTAAHVIDAHESSQDLHITFETPSTGRFTISAGQAIQHDTFAGSKNGNDVALINVTEWASLLGVVPRYRLANKGDYLTLFNQELIVVGWGIGGSGATGENPGVYPSGQFKRAGKNRYDDYVPNYPFGSSAPIRPFTQLAFDFDNGSPANDFFGEWSEVHDTGYGADEVGTARGDSGGPTFIADGQRIVGVHSWAARIPVNVPRPNGETYHETDYDDVGDPLSGEPTAGNRSWGEFMVDANVTHPLIYDWIDRVAYKNAHTESEVNPPGLDQSSAWEDPDTWSYGGVPQSNETAYIDPWTDEFTPVYIEGPGYINGPSTTINVAGTVVGTGAGYKGLYLDWGGTLNNTNDILFDTNGYGQLTYGTLTADRLIVQGTTPVFVPPTAQRGTFIHYDPDGLYTNLSVDTILARDAGTFGYVATDDVFDANHLQIEQGGQAVIETDMTLNQSLTNSGELNLGAQFYGNSITVGTAPATGTFQQTSTGSMLPLLGPTGSGGMIGDAIHVLGDATIAGTLDAVLTAGFNLSPHTFYSLIVADEVIGTFDDELFPISGNLTLRTIYWPDAVLLSTVSLQPGDADGDGDVDNADLLTVKSTFGNTWPQSILGDTDGDLDVDIHDFIAVKNNFGSTYPGLTPGLDDVALPESQRPYNNLFPFPTTAQLPAVPEPASLALLTLGSVTFLLRKSPNHQITKYPPLPPHPRHPRNLPADKLTH